MKIDWAITILLLAFLGFCMSVVWKIWTSYPSVSKEVNILLKSINNNTNNWKKVTIDSSTSKLVHVSGYTLIVANSFFVYPEFKSMFIFNSREEALICKAYLRNFSDPFKKEKYDNRVIALNEIDKVFKNYEHQE